MFEYSRVCCALVFVTTFVVIILSTVPSSSASSRSSRIRRVQTTSNDDSDRDAAIALQDLRPYQKRQSLGSLLREKLRRDDVSFKLKLDSPTVQGDDHSFDYFLLSIEWPGSACVHFSQRVVAGGCFANTSTSFTIHGLWPSKIGTSVGPTECSSMPFDYDALLKQASVIEKMRLLWHDYLGNEARFWGHEWVKHGSCALSAPNFKCQLDYFSNALALLEKMPILAVLEKAGIVPSADKDYAVDDILGTLKRAFGASPFMACHRGDLFGELRFCFDKELKIIECADRETTGCATRVSFLPVSQTKKFI